LPLSTYLLQLLYLFIELIDIVRVSDGKMVEYWSIGDTLGMMEQLGVIPQPEDAEEASPT
jgi:hypothetical protein